MLALNDDQLAVVMTAAGGLPVEKRDLFLQRVAAYNASQEAGDRKCKSTKSYRSITKQSL